MLEIYECSWSNNKTIERHHKFNWQWHVILCTANIWLIVISPYAQVHPYLYSLSHLSVKICSCSTWHGKLKLEVPHSFSIYEFSIHAPPPYNLSQIFDKNNKDQMSRRFHMKPHRSLVSELTCKFKRYMAQLCLNKMHRKQSTYNLPIK